MKSINGRWRIRMSSFRPLARQMGKIADGLVIGFGYILARERI